jgi:signal transduction histidine kinase
LLAARWPVAAANQAGSTGTEPPRQATTLSEEVERIRRRLARSVLVLFAVLGGAALASSLARTAVTGCRPVMVVQVALYAGVVVLVLAGARVPLWVQTWYIAGSAYLLGVAGLATFGFSGGGWLFLCMAVVYAALLRGIRAGVLALAAVAIAVACMAVLVQRGLLIYEVDFNLYASRAVNWWNYLASLLLLLVVMLGALAALGQGVIDSYQHIEAQKRHLEEARRTLEAELSERRRVEAELSRALGELDWHRRTLEERVEQRSAQLRVAERELVERERLATLGRLTAGVAHELRNPLGVLALSTEALRMHCGGQRPEVDRALDRSLRSIASCEVIVANMVAYVRRDNAVRTPTSVDTWLDQILDDLELPEGVALRRELASRATLAIDRDSLGRCVINLVRNAAEALEAAKGPEKSITVQSELLDDTVELRVIDNGPGMPPEVLARAFEPLFTTKRLGFGLGLSIVERTVRGHQGKVEIRSQPGEGAAVTLRLPLKEHAS